MAAGRFLSTSVSEDVRLNSISVEAQMMYLMTIPHLDRDGIINGNPSVLRGRVCPLREDFMGKMAGIINEWVQAGLVIKYADGDDTALWFKGFAKNNPLTHYNREKASKFAPPPGYIRGEKGLVPADDGKAPESSGNPPDTSGKNPYRSEVEVDDDIDASIADDSESLPDAEPPTESERIYDRLAKEWMTVNKTQVDNHSALVKRYGYDAWLVGFEACSRGQRSNHTYVEKAILSAIDRNPALELSKPKIPTHKYIITDPVTGARKEVLM